MPDPERWRDDASTSPELRHALSALRPSRPLPEEVRERSAHRIAIMVAFPAFMAAIFTTKGVAAAILAGCVTAAVVVSVVVSSSHAPPPRPLHAHAPIAIESASVQSTSINVAMARAATAPASTSSAPAFALVHATPSPVSSNAGVAKPSAPASAPTPAESSSSADPLQEEVHLLQDAKAHVTSAPLTALARVHEHEVKFPHGTLAIEREMVAVEALMSAGRRQDARARAARLRPSLGGSIYAERLDALVGDSKMQ